MEPAEEKVRCFSFSLHHFVLVFFSRVIFRSPKAKTRREHHQNSTVRHQVLREVHEAQREDRAAVRRAVVSGRAADRRGDEEVIFYLIFLDRFLCFPL